MWLNEWLLLQITIHDQMILSLWKWVRFIWKMKWWDPKNNSVSFETIRISFRTWFVNSFERLLSSKPYHGFHHWRRKKKQPKTQKKTLLYVFRRVRSNANASLGYFFSLAPIISFDFILNVFFLCATAAGAILKSTVWECVPKTRISIARQGEKEHKKYILFIFNIKTLTRFKSLFNTIWCMCVRWLLYYWFCYAELLLQPAAWQPTSLA